MAATKTTRKSDLPTILAAVIGTALFAVTTYVVVDVAGGTSVDDSGYSNTPNGILEGPPEAK